MAKLSGGASIDKALSAAVTAAGKRVARDQRMDSFLSVPGPNWLLLRLRMMVCCKLCAHANGNAAVISALTATLATASITMANAQAELAAKTAEFASIYKD